MGETTTFYATMPADVATALLLSGQSMSNRFRKVCKTARERIAEPVSRSTRFNISAPATPLQNFERKLRKANAAQLTKWSRRASRKGDRLQDLLFDTQAASNEKLAAFLRKQIYQVDLVSQAIKDELDNRSTRGKLKHV